MYDVLLVDDHKIHLKTEQVDLAGALEEAQNRVININAAPLLSLSTSIAETPAPVVDVFGD